MTTIPNAKVKAVAERVVKEFRLAADKVAAHHGEPDKFPMPSGSSATEHLLARRFKTLTEGQKKEAAGRVAADLKNGAARSKKLGDLAKVDLRSPTPVEAQVRSIPFPDSLKFPADELREVPATAVPESAQAVTAVPLNKLNLRLHRVKCVEATSELGADEIDWGACEIDESGDTRKISPFRVRSFKDGDVQTYAPAKQVTFFSLTESTVQFPKSYFVTMVLAEVDSGDFADFLNDLLAKVKTQVVAAIAAAVGGALGSPGGPIGIAIGMAVGVVVSQIFEYLKGWWGNEYFQPVTVSTVVPSLTSRWNGSSDSPERTVVYAGHGGRYELVCSWQMRN
ncbi:hypothetical protein [Streptomyces sp. SID12501]|uniref:Uncharacterized protein n=1 Tax=Streptomyces sp. SID12501 TaxID=2706042 RepID=A0A6B3BQE2_9ACTN|nr:hypothetical protein [Streptomyces sp. SID12501]NEC86548.1 hypothetical protein [Streptomyces sp. SID12501]